MNVYNIILTRNCKQRCDFCFVSKKGSINPDLFNKVLNFLLYQKKYINKIKFCGGEPLLAFKKITSIIEHLLKIKKENCYIEIQTNGVLLTDEKINYFKRYPFIQININSSVTLRKNFIFLPNIVWALPISYINPENSLKILNKILNAYKKTREVPRINVLPSYYINWGKNNKILLIKVLNEIKELSKTNKIIIENNKRCGSIPLFNDGITIDVDGKIYSNNLVLAVDKSNQAINKILIGDINKNYSINKILLDNKAKIYETAKLIFKNKFKETLLIDKLLSKILIYDQ